MFRIKICGVTNIADALAVEASGADALGMIFCPSLRRISPEQARSIHQVLGGKILRVGVFLDQSADEVYMIAKYCGLDYVQLHGSEEPAWADQLGIPYLKSLHADELKTEDLMIWRETQVAAVLLDSSQGGSGRTFEWSRFPVDRSLGKPLILAGGLNSGNVAEAIRRLRPDGIDVGSGVEATPGIKDHQKIIEFVAAAHDGYRQMQEGL